MITPLHDRIIVKRIEPETVTESGIVIPGVAQETQNCGVVLATGPGRMNDNGNIIPLTVKVGYTVFFGSGIGQTIRVEEGDVLAMREEDLYAYVEEQ